jgi:hypothetical protein
MFMAIVPALILCVSAVATDPPANGETVPAKIEAFLKLCETSRKGAIVQLEYTLRGLRSQDSKSPDTLRRIASVEEDLRTLRANEQPVVPTLAFPPTTGAIGRLPRLACYVDQIVSESEMLVRCSFPVRITTVRRFQAQGETIVQPVTFLIRGVTTRQAHEGTDLQMVQVFEITGKKTYRTVDGRTSTAWVVSEFNMKAVEPYFRKSKSARP